MPADTMFVVPRTENRQAQIEAMELGDTVSLSRRVDLSMGLAEETIREHTHQLRGILDQQATRARRKVKGSKFTVENGTFITRANALIIVAVCTRVE